MARLRERDKPIADRTRFQRTAELLGGARILKQVPADELELHELLLRGLPGKALQHVIGNLIALKIDEFVERALGMSLRTFQRHKAAPEKPLNPEHSGRLWKLAEILVGAMDLLGSQEDAERWLQLPAMGLNRHRPIDLLATPAGVDVLETFMNRLRYGVYT